jgi:hypothetical protein
VYGVCDTRLMLTGLNADLSSKMGASAEATFVRLDQGPYHDGFRFVVGTVITMMQLGTGVRATVIDSLVEPVWPVGGRVRVPASVLG